MIDRQEAFRKLTVSYLHECFSLDGEKGVLIWEVRPVSHFDGDLARWRRNNAKWAGKVAGTINQGRRLVTVDGIKNFVQRIVYSMSRGIDLADIPRIIDHIDGDTLNDRPDNLRAATRHQNMFNRKRLSRNTSGWKGAFYDKKLRGWTARIEAYGVQTYLGTYDTREEAGAAYQGAARVLHKEFYREILEPADAAA